ncbi:MAG: AEC family transporter [Salinisphaera sp.]|jgi:malonate transporter|nr:AEC family transporter [Salinisphaera sp.]
MLAVEQTLGPLFVLILVGALLGWQQYPGGDFWPRAERLIYYLLFPALLIKALATARFAAVPVAGIAITSLGTLLAFALLLWISRRRLPIENSAFTSVFQGALRFNTYVAIGGATALHGAQGTAVAAVVIALLVPTVNILSVLCFILTGTLGRTGLWRGLAELLRNPLIVSCAIGIALNASGIGLPGWSAPVLGLIGQAALPLALIAVGVALRPAALLRSGRAFWISTAVRLVLLPAATLTMAWLTGLDSVSRDVVLLFAAASTATSAYILSRQLGGDSELMAAIVTGQTLLSMLTLPIWLGWLS